MLFLGFSAGLPLLLVYSTLTAWLSDYDVKKSTIGLFAWVGITYSVKLFWAPVVDRLHLPLLRRMGQRRSWMLLAQAGIVFGLYQMSQLNPADSLKMVALWGVFVAFCSATQDIALDAYRIEAVETDRQAAMASTYIFGYRIAMLFAGAGALYIAQYQSWPFAYQTMAASMLVGIITVILIAEPISNTVRSLAERGPLVERFEAQASGWLPPLRTAVSWILGAVVEPFVDFFRRNGLGLALLILGVVAFYRLSDLSMGAMSNPFYLDMGFSKAEIATVVKSFGLAMTLIGAGLGGVMAMRYGTLKSLLVAAIMVATTNLLFAWIATQPKDISYLAGVIAADNLSAGIATTVFIAFLSGLTNTAYTATQYALFSSLMTLPGKIIAGYSGFVVEAQGYATFFIYVAALGIPAIVLVSVLIHWNKARQLLATPAESARQNATADT